MTEREPSVSEYPIETQERATSYHPCMELALEMHWRELLFASWPVDPDIVAAHLPDALAVDTDNGKAWLSIVPFTNGSVRPHGIPESLGVDLPECNLRTYVTVDGTPSIYFFSLDAEGILAVLGARLLHYLPYYYARIHHDTTGPVRFASRRRHPGARPARFAAAYEPTGEQLDVEPGSRAEFLTERYRFYTETPDGTVRYTDVEHDRWPLYSANVKMAKNTFFRANGFADPTGEPVCYYSPGMDIVASQSRRKEQ